MAISNSVAVTVDLNFQDDFTGPAGKAFEQFRRNAEVAFQGVAEAGINVFSRIREACGRVSFLVAGKDHLKSVEKKCTDQNQHSYKKKYEDNGFARIISKGEFLEAAAITAVWANKSFVADSFSAFWAVGHGHIRFSSFKSLGRTAFLPPL